MLAEPRSGGAAFLAHRLKCRACAAWTRRLRRRDALIGDALGVPLPEGLAERVALRAAWQRPRAGRRWTGIAAAGGAVALGALLAVQLVDRPALADVVLAHVYHEPDLLLPAETAVDPARLRAVLGRIGGRLDGELGKVTHAGLCPINGRLAAHLVVEGDSGPVAVLVMPEHGVHGAMPVDSGTLHGRIVPVGRGSVAVIGGRGESVDALAARIGSQLRFDRETAI